MYGQIKKAIIFIIHLVGKIFRAVFDGIKWVLLSIFRGIFLIFWGIYQVPRWLIVNLVKAMGYVLYYIYAGLRFILVSVYQGIRYIFVNFFRGIYWLAWGMYHVPRWLVVNLVKAIWYVLYCIYDGLAFMFISTIKAIWYVLYCIYDGLAFMFISTIKGIWYVLYCIYDGLAFMFISTIKGIWYVIYCVCDAIVFMIISTLRAIWYVIYSFCDALLFMIISTYQVIRYIIIKFFYGIFLILWGLYQGPRWLALTSVNLIKKIIHAIRYATRSTVGTIFNIPRWCKQRFLGLLPKINRGIPGVVNEIQYKFIVVQAVLNKTYNYVSTKIQAKWNPPQNISVNTEANQPSLLEQNELNFIEDSKKAVLRYETYFTRKFIYAIAAFFLIFFVWAQVSEIDEITIGEGNVVPSSEVQMIQNLEGGILSHIYVTEGDIVQKGQVILQIDVTQTASQYEQYRAQYLTLLATQERLEAEIGNKDRIDFPPELANHVELTTHERNVFHSHQQALRESVANLQRSYDYMAAELKIMRPLVKEKVVSDVEMIRMERDANDLQGKIIEKVNTYRNDAIKQLDQTKSDLAAITETLKGLKDRMVRTTIKAPVRGVVNEIFINTIGGVIKPGADILEIVPLEDNLIVQVKVKPADIAFIKPGQKAMVKFSAYDYAIYGGLPGVVKNISPTTITDAQGRVFYQVKIRTNKNYLGSSGKPLPILPGMISTADIITGHRTIMHYLLKPILKAQEKALRER